MLLFCIEWQNNICWQWRILPHRPWARAQRCGVHSAHCQNSLWPFRIFLFIRNTYFIKISPLILNKIFVRLIPFSGGRFSLARPATALIFGPSSPGLAKGGMPINFKAHSTLISSQNSLPPNIAKDREWPAVLSHVPPTPTLAYPINSHGIPDIFNHLRPWQNNHGPSISWHRQ